MNEVESVELGSYRFDIGNAKRRLEELRADKVVIQLPDGLKTKAKQFEDMFEIETVIWGGSCYGACDLPQSIGDADALLHVGHAEIPNIQPDHTVIYLEGRSTRWKSLPENFFERVKDKGGKISLYAPVQHLHHLEKAVEEIEEAGFEAIIGEGGDRIKYPGQVLGCNYSVKVAEADHHLYIGTGRFHPLGLSFSLKRDVIVYNPVTGELSAIGERERDVFLRKRFGRLAQFRDAERVMVINSTKKGQKRTELAEEMRRLGERAGKEMTLIDYDEIKPIQVDDFGWDCAVCTACPRIALDDQDQFRTTILSPIEFKIEVEKGKTDDWQMDEIH